MLLRETKVSNTGDEDYIARRGRSLGWNCIASSAHRIAADPASSGCAIAVRRGVGISPHEHHVRDSFRHRLHVAWVAGVLHGGLHCASIWLQDSEGLSAENFAIRDAASLRGLSLQLRLCSDLMMLAFIPIGQPDWYYPAMGGDI